MKSRAKKYTPDFKLKIVNYAIHTNITQASYIFEVTRKSISKWLKLYHKKGYEGLLERKKREDKQPKKLTESILKKISRARLDFPDLTLRDIKDKYQLDCSLVLISKRLKDFFEEYFKEHQKLIVTFRVITKRNSGGRKKRIYQFNIYDCMNKKLYFGFGKERNIKNLCSFISHVIDGLKDKNMIRDDAYISSNLKYLKQLSCENSHYHKNVYSKHRLPLLIENNKHLLRSRINKLDYSNNEKGLMVSAYEDMILNSENVLLIHPSVVDCGDRKGSLDSFVKLNSTGVMKETMKLIEKYGDNALISFDFDAAFEFYNRIYLTSIECKEDNWESIKLGSMYKMLTIHIHFTDFKKSRNVIDDFLDSQYANEVEYYGEVYNLLGLISFYENKRKDADKYFTQSVEIFLDKSKKEHIFDYYRVNIRKYINRQNYRLALDFANKYIRTASNHNDEKELLKANGMKGIVYHYAGNMKMSEKCFKKQLDIAIRVRDYTEEAKAINNLLSVITYTSTEPKNLIEKYISRMKILAVVIKKECYLYEAFQFSATYHSSTGNYEQAVKDYKETVKGCFKYFDKYNLVSNIFCLAYSFFNIKDTSNAIKYFKEVCAYSNETDIDYHSSALNYIGRIYLDNNALNKSMRYYNLSRKTAGHDLNNYTVADSLKSIGLIYERREIYKASLNFYKRALSSFRRQNKNLKIVSDNIVYIKERIQLLKK